VAEPQEFGGKRCLYLDDLAVGRRFTSATHVIDAAQIKAFAAQFDPQPFHLDDEKAKGTLFAGLAASGWHTAAITMRLLVETGLPLAGGIIGAGGEIRWPKPTRPGDVLRVVSEIEAVTPSRSRGDRGTVRVRSETRNQRDEVVQVLIAKPHRAAPRNLASVRRACGRIGTNATAPCVSSSVAGRIASSIAPSTAT
jgi:acyl dehydratase